MDHNFVPSQLNADTCAKCKYNQRAHTNFAQCETCPNIGVCDIFTDMLMCQSCIAAEKTAILAHQSIDKQTERLENHNHKTINLLAESRNIDQSIQLDTDIYNAKTHAFSEIFKAIDEDDTITNKALLKAEFVHGRHLQLQKLIFEAKQLLNEYGNEQRAAQVQLNQLANQLRADERARLKIEDINYQPAAPKASKPRSGGTKVAATQAKKQSAKEMVEQANLWAAKIGMPGTVIHMRMLAKNMTAEQATRTLASELNLTVKD